MILLYINFKFDLKQVEPNVVLKGIKRKHIIESNSRFLINALFLIFKLLITYEHPVLIRGLYLDFINPF